MEGMKMSNKEKKISKALAKRRYAEVTDKKPTGMPYCIIMIVPGFVGSNSATSTRGLSAAKEMVGANASTFGGTSPVHLWKTHPAPKPLQRFCQNPRSLP